MHGLVYPEGWFGEALDELVKSQSDWRL